MTADQMNYEFEVGYDKITNFDAPGYEPKEISTFLTRAQEIIVYELFEASANDEKNRKALSRLRQVINVGVFTNGTYPNGELAQLRNIYSGGTALTFTNPDTITDSGSGFLTSGIRIGDEITVVNSVGNTSDGTYVVINIVAGTLTLSSETPIVNGTGNATTEIHTYPVLKVRNERADIDVGSDNFYYGRVAGNNIEDLDVEPIDDDFYHANKDNPFKKPSVEKVWRIEYTDINRIIHEYITDGTYTMDDVHIHFDRRPRPIIIVDSTYTTVDGSIDGVYFADYDTTGLDCELDPIIHREIGLCCTSRSNRVSD